MRHGMRVGETMDGKLVADVDGVDDATRGVEVEVDVEIDVDRDETDGFGRTCQPGMRCCK
jgi:hypothetical protein